MSKSMSSSLPPGPLVLRSSISGVNLNCLWNTIMIQIRAETRNQTKLLEDNMQSNQQHICA